MNIENRELIERTSSVLDKIMNFFRKVVNKQTITDKGMLHHAGELEPGTCVYQDEDMTTPATSDVYTTAAGGKISIKAGTVQKVAPAPPAEDDDTDTTDDDDTPVSDKLKPRDVQSRIDNLKAKLHAQNALLKEANAALEEANTRLKKNIEQVKNEIRSEFTPEGSRRSNKAKTEQTPFFAPQSTIAKNAVKRAVTPLTP